MKYLIPILVISFLILPFIVRAAGCNSCDCLDALGMPRVAKLCNLIDDIGFILYVFGAGFAIVMIIAGGIMYVTAGEGEDKAKKAKKTIINGLIGAAIIAASGFLFNLVANLIASRLGS